MRWVSLSGEFAFLSVGGTARGIIAIGGVAHGVVAVGAVVSVGVISIGMNALGSVIALGMNAVAPLSLSLINGLGFYAKAGVNGWGVWSDAGTNATGLSGHGGVNTGRSALPAVLLIVLMLVLSSAFRGKRAPRKRDDVLPLRRFVRSTELSESIVRARLVAVHEDAIELADGPERLTPRADRSLVARARALSEAGAGNGAAVLAHLARAEELVAVAGEVGYRERPGETARVVVACSSIAAAPELPSWLPTDVDEVQWVIAWTARIAAVVATALLLRELY